MKNLKENLLWQFTLVSLVVIVLVTGLLSWWLGETVKGNVLDEAVQQAADTVSRRISNAISPEDLKQPMVGERYEAFNDYMERYIVSERTARIKLWDNQGRVIFSTDRSQVRQSFPIKPALSQALTGGVGRSISVPKGAENERERLLGTLIEVYVPIKRQDTGEIVGAFETYQYYSPYAEFIARDQGIVYIGAIFGGLAVFLALVFMVRQAWRTILRQRSEMNLRLREVHGLNALFEGHLAQRMRVLEALQKLGQSRAVVDGLSREEIFAQYNHLKNKVDALAQEASHFPSLEQKLHMDKAKD